MPHSTSPIGTDIQDPASELRRIPLPRTRVNKSLGYSSRSENSSKASRAFEAFSCLGPGSPHAKHHTTQQPSSVSWTRSGVCAGQNLNLENLEEACMRFSRSYAFT